MYAKQDYIRGNCSHDEYYGQFVTLSVINTVSAIVGDQLLMSVGVDLRGIPRSTWHAAAFPVSRIAGEALRKADPACTVADFISVAQTAARIFKLMAI